MSYREDVAREQRAKDYNNIRQDEISKTINPLSPEKQLSGAVNNWFVPINSNSILDGMQQQTKMDYEIGKNWYKKGRSLKIAPLKLQNNKAFCDGYERARRDEKNAKYLYGVNLFHMGVSILDLPDDKDIIEGYESEQIKYNSMHYTSRKR